MINRPCITAEVAIALAEDVGAGDLTAALLSDTTPVIAQVMTRELAVVAGQPWAAEVFRQIDANIEVVSAVPDGTQVQPGEVILCLRGMARSLLTGERCALNFLQTLSGTATTVAAYVRAIRGYPVTLLDTRKTIPGLRYAQKYAVVCGGGANHRMGLYDAILIKENHITSCGSIRAAVSRAKNSLQQRTGLADNLVKNAPVKIEVEVENLLQLEEALQVGVDQIMLDNFDLPLIKEGVKRCRAWQQSYTHRKPVPLEISGNIDLNNIHIYAATGVDYISVGALTKHVRAIDLSMRLQQQVRNSRHILTH